MNHRKLGNTGTTVSEIALGTWITFGGQIGEDAARQVLHAAFDSGINFVDTADVYELGRAESVLGELLREVPRRDYVLATKVYFPMGDGPNDRGLSRKHVCESIEASLRRLNTDYVDLYQCHRYDESVPLEETVRAMDDLVRQGKILHWGVSMWRAHQIVDACRLAERRNADRPVTNQPRYNLLDRSIEEHVIPACEREGIGQIVFSPLAQGLLTGKYLGGQIPSSSRANDERINRFLKPWMTPTYLERADRFAAFARECGTTPAQLALLWCLRQPNVSSVIIGATRPEQVRENAMTCNLDVGPEVFERIEAIFAPDEEVAPGA